MTGALPRWLEGRHALVVGTNSGAEAAARGLAGAGASLVRAGFALEHAAAELELDHAAVALGGPLDVLVHCGDAPELGPTQAMDLAAWRAALNAGLDSRFFYAATLARKCIATGRPASILLLDLPESAAGVANAAAAGATGNLVKTLAVEWARDRLRVNAIVARCVQGGSSVELETLGALAAYLCSDYAAYVTGATVGVDLPG